jgi:putative hydrolase of the HAD superfamily
MLHWLRQRGLRVGVVSNCTVEEVAAWADSQLAPLVDCTVWSYRAGVAKPHPRIYRLACEQLGVEPAEAIFIGDGGSDELAGAARAGMRSYQAYWFLIRRPNGTKLPAIQRFQPLLAPAELEGRLDALHAAR